MATQNSYDFMATLPPPPQRTFVAPPAEPTPIAQVVEALRGVTPLAGLTDDEYHWLATHGTEITGEDGDLIFTEGTPADKLLFILKGEVHVRRFRSGGLALFIGRSGQMTGKLPYSRMKSFGGEGYCVGSSWGLQLHESLFPEMLAAIPSMTQRCVSALLDRVREVTRIEQQSEKLSSLGKLAANLAHELNNPASAAQRSAAGLFAELRAYGVHKYRLGSLCLSADQSDAYMAWSERARKLMNETNSLRAIPENPLTLADREDELIRWLEAHNVPEPWNIAPALAETRLGTFILDELADVLHPDILPVALATVASSLRAERMAETVVDSTIRIFDLISAIKDYSYMDQAPIQEVDLPESLTNTLAMFHSRLEGVNVELDFDPAVPTIGAYGSELNQVWTALLENALDAVTNPATRPPVPTIRLKTHLAGQTALVEFWDNGPGIEPALQSRIFEPFFTTKAPGHGLGLGLDTAQRIVNKHSGFLTVQSKPSETCFQVCLPLNPAEAY
jgi:signal transduction histidine kinase